MDETPQKSRKARIQTKNKKENITEIATEKKPYLLEDFETDEAEFSTQKKLNSLKNLQLGANLKKANKYRFDRGNGHGNKIEGRDRHWILRLFYWFKCQDFYSSMSDNQVYTILADVACCGRSTVEGIVKDGRIDAGDQRGHDMMRKIDFHKAEELKEDIVSEVKKSLEAGIPLSSKDIRAWLHEKENISMHKTTIWTYLRNWGISWKKLQQEEYRKERNYVIYQRHLFLKEVNEELKLPLKSCRHRICDCERKRMLVYIDESYIHQHHVAAYGLTVDDYPLQKPSGKGRRVVMAAGLTEAGWLGTESITSEDFSANEDNEYNLGSISYWTAKVGGEYHRNYNHENFERFFQENILNNLTEPSLLIMDRAAYHSKHHEDEFFPSKAKKAELKEWLDENKIEYDRHLLKKDLKLLVTTHWIAPKNIFEVMAEEHGINNFGYPHRILYLPPYHAEYNAIELAWGRIKSYAGRNPTYNMTRLLDETLPRGFMEVTKEVAKNLVAHVIKKYAEDLDSDVDPLMITEKIQENQS